MPFQALSGAPDLRDGVRLNIMAYPQAAGRVPERLAPGAQVTVRLGHCCPTVKEGRVAAVEDEPLRVVLTVDDATWTLVPEAEDMVVVTVPGIVSENWIVRGACFYSSGA